MELKNLYRVNGCYNLVSKELELKIFDNDRYAISQEELASKFVKCDNFNTSVALEELKNIMIRNHETAFYFDSVYDTYVEYDDRKDDYEELLGDYYSQYIDKDLLKKIGCYTTQELIDIACSTVDKDKLVFDKCVFENNNFTVYFKDSNHKIVFKIKEKLGDLDNNQQLLP